MELFKDIRLTILLFSSFSMLLVSFNFTYSNASDEFMKEKVAEIQTDKASLTSGCPSGYTVWGVFEDECLGMGTIKKSCPKGFGKWVEYDCFADSKYQSCPSPAIQGYHTEMIPPGFASDPYVTCVGPFIETVICPPGFTNRNPDTSPSDPDTKTCVGPRQF
jgi:hypothetical protein